MTAPQKPKTLKERIGRYGVAGLLATAVYFVAVSGLVEFAAVPPVPAAAIATLIVMITSYLVNRAWVFDTTRSHSSSFTRFAIASLLSIALNTGLMHLAVNVLGWRYLIGALLTTAVVPPINFVVNYLWAFRPTSQDVT